MSSTGLKSLAGLTRARHRGNVAPSNLNHSTGPPPGALFLSTLKLRRRSTQIQRGCPAARRPPYELTMSRAIVRLTKSEEIWSLERQKARS